MFSKKRTLHIIGAAVAGVAIIAIAASQKNSTPSAPATPRSTPTRQAVAPDIPVPEIGSPNVPPNVAVPKTVADAAPKAEAKFRVFDLKFANGAVEPETVIVREGDTIRLNLLAVDRAYDFTQPDYGFNLELPKGTPKVLEFAGVQTGKFLFYCKQCGGPDKGPLGYILVAPKPAQ